MKYSGNISYGFEIEANTASDALTVVRNLYSSPEIGEKVKLTSVNITVDNDEIRKRKQIQEQQRTFNKYPIGIMQELREAAGLDENDNSHDEQLNSMSPSEAFEEILNFKGFIHCASQIKTIVKDVYHVDLDEIKEKPQHDQNLTPIEQYCKTLGESDREHTKENEQDF